MVAIISLSKSSSKYRHQGFGSRQSIGIILFFLAIASLFGLYFFELVQYQGEIAVGRVSSFAAIASSPVLRGQLDYQPNCRFYLAESAIPRSGLGIYTAIDLQKGEEAQSMPDVCIYVADTPRGTEFETHSWSRDTFIGTYEGRHPRAACEGVATLFNSLPDSVGTSKLVPLKMHTNAGLSRYTEPGAGAITHYYGISSEAIRDVEAGSELTIDYGDWKYEEGKEYEAPTRSVDWVRKHGMCIDNIKIQQSTHRDMGRGAFAQHSLRQGSLVAPAPLQTYPDQSVFARQKPEALFVNYCFQPKDTDILLFPYGPGINMINHDSQHPNVALRWSSSSLSHHDWLDLPLEKFLGMTYPGALILEVYALRNIREGEEMFMDYGEDWEMAWKKHVRKWKPKKYKDYVYPADMDTTKPFLTVSEQKKISYAKNLQTLCSTTNWDRDENTRMKWKGHHEYWPQGLVYCNILERKEDKYPGSFNYTVALGFHPKEPPAIDEKTYVDYDVPHSAIMWVDKPYTSDLHLKNAFRHPIGLPDNLAPEQWRE